LVIRKWKMAIAATTRRHKSPIPGQPRANVEYRRCKRKFPLSA
jgi:hypothetical protein